MSVRLAGVDLGVRKVNCGDYRRHLLTIADRMNHEASELSGGEQEFVAIAVAS